MITITFVPHPITVEGHKECVEEKIAELQEMYGDDIEIVLNLGVQGYPVHSNKCKARKNK